MPFRLSILSISALPPATCLNTPHHLLSYQSALCRRWNMTETVRPLRPTYSTPAIGYGAMDLFFTLQHHDLSCTTSSRMYQMLVV
eukprot:scaffold218673_cov23-Cyclotella_meneghiniana.AAC.1